MHSGSNSILNLRIFCKIGVYLSFMDFWHILYFYSDNLYNHYLNVKSRSMSKIINQLVLKFQMRFPLKNIVGWVTSKIQHNALKNEIQQISSFDNEINQDNSSLCSWYPQDEASLFALKYANYPSSSINNRIYKASSGKNNSNDFNNLTSKVPLTVPQNDVIKLPSMSIEPLPTIESVVNSFATAQNQNELPIEIS